MHWHQRQNKGRSGKEQGILKNRCCIYVFHYQGFGFPIRPFPPLLITPLRRLCYIEACQKFSCLSFVPLPCALLLWSEPTLVLVPQEKDCVWHVNSIAVNQALSKHKQPTLDTAQTCLSSGSHSVIALLAECRDTSWWYMVQCFLESCQSALQNTGKYFRHIVAFQGNAKCVVDVQIAWPGFCPVVLRNTA